MAAPISFYYYCLSVFHFSVAFIIRCLKLSTFGTGRRRLPVFSYDPRPKNPIFFMFHITKGFRFFFENAKKSIIILSYLIDFQRIFER